MFPFTKKQIKKSHILDFEQPLINLAEQITSLSEITNEEQIKTLKDELEKLKQKIYSSLEPAQIVQIARHPLRPYINDLIPYLGTNWTELHGDREGYDDQSIVGGLIELDGKTPIMLIGNHKGYDIRDKQKRNFGMAQPWGYRKALRLFKHAEKFQMPIVTLVDTPGAYPGLEAEELGQSFAIARNIQELSAIKTPVISIVTGEGGSGGALALATANIVLALQYSIYSVISPEGCAAILWRDRKHANEAAKQLRVITPELKKLNLIDGIITEPTCGAHHDHEITGLNVKEAIIKHLADLNTLSIDELVQHRQVKYENYGFYNETSTV